MAIPRVRGKSRNDIEKISHNDLEYFDPECLVSPKALCVWQVFDMLDDFGIETGVIDGLGVEGMCFSNDGVITIFVDSYTYDGCCKDMPRDRFTIMHEIFHALHHQRYLLDSSVTSTVMYRRSELKAYEDPEWQANSYASAILMPAKSTLEVIENSTPFTATDNVMETFIVSRSAAEKRIENLKKMDLI